MRKIYSLMLAAMVSVSAVAMPSTLSKSAKYPGHEATSVVDGFKAQHLLEKGASASAIKKAMSRPQSEAQYDPILNPEGQRTAYSVDATCFSEIPFVGITYTRGTYPTEIVWGENGDVYIRDIVTMATTGVYVKGTYADGKITVQLPQICYYEYYEPEYEDEEPEEFALYASVAEVFTYEQDGQTFKSFRNVEDPEQNYVVYNVSEDGVITLDLNSGDPEDTDTPPERIIALVGDTTPGVADWWGMGDSYQTYTKFDLEPVTVPDGVELEEWALIAENASGFLKVGFDGDDVYFSEFWEEAPQLVFKGRVEGDKVLVDTQFMGEEFGYFLYMQGCKWEDDNFEDCELLDTVEMNYDAQNKIISTDNPLIDLLFNTTTTQANPVEYLENPTFRYQAADEANAAPADPSVTYYDPVEYRDYLGIEEGYIEWDIPNINVNGFLLDTAKMYYHFLVDDEVMTFTTDEYPEFEEDLTDVPYDYTDGWDIQVLDQDHYFSFRFTDFATLGLQSFYVGSDGVTYASNVVTYTPAGIDTVIGGKEIKNAEFFDIDGRRVINPTRGFYVVRYTYTDGSTAVSKIVK